LHEQVTSLEADIQLMATKLAAQAFELSEAGETIEQLRALTGGDDDTITSM
jgi:hypothetical protein